MSCRLCKSEHPDETHSDPHPFISLLTPIKGKKILPRLSRHIPAHRLPTLLTLLVACFSQLDVVSQAQILDCDEDSPARQEVERQTAAFLGSVLQSILPVVARAELRLVTGLLGLFLDRSDIIHVTQTRVRVTSSHRSNRLTFYCAAWSRNADTVLESRRNYQTGSEQRHRVNRNSDA